LKNGNPDQGMDLYRKAIQYQPELKRDVAQQCFEAGKQYLDRRNSRMADSLFAMSVNYDNTLKEDINAVTQKYGISLLAIAKDKPK